MSEILQRQIDEIKKEFEYKTLDNGDLIFHRSSKSISTNKVRVVFEKYFVDVYNGFDFHEKFNHGIAPKAYVMIGEIRKETEKMYLLKLYNETSKEKWSGWCPKKCCKIEKV